MEDEHIAAPATVSDLTPRQIAVAALVANGIPTKKIAASLGISDRRVRMHITSIVYVLHLDPERNAWQQIAQWYRTHAAPISGLPPKGPAELELEQREA